MRWGVSGQPLDANLPYASVIGTACTQLDFPPCFAYAIGWVETISGEVAGLWPSAARVISGDGGHGLFQLTSWVPDNWDDPAVNTGYAIRDWLLPDVQYWNRQRAQVGDALVKCVAASFNGGLGGAQRGFDEGDVNKYTTNGYGSRVVAAYHRLVAGHRPG